jgi:hypothetical protein
MFVNLISDFFKLVDLEFRQGVNSKEKTAFLLVMRKRINNLDRKLIKEIVGLYGLNISKASGQTISNYLILDPTGLANFICLAFEQQNVVCIYWVLFYVRELYLKSTEL